MIRSHANPILAAFRKRGTSLRLWLRPDAFDGQGYTQQQIEDAQKVLARLLAVMAVSS